ncbi:hypothetical protein TYRP_000052 [Tyrophagus putrescentiae]|nr:hypothetical protein TYRP_000052 [Tyrophagus putrescentiae]
MDPVTWTHFSAAVNSVAGDGRVCLVEYSTSLRRYRTSQNQQQATHSTGPLCIAKIFLYEKAEF